MPFVETRTQFPSFTKSKDFFKSGLGSAPKPPPQPPPIATAAAAGVGGATSTIAPPSPTINAVSPGAISQPSTQPSSTIDQPSAYQPVSLGYQTTGSVESRLFDPIGEATQAGEAQLTEFADMFRTKAGESRTFEGIGAAGTLEGAIQGGDLGAAKELVGAQYAGPQGLDPAGAGDLMTLAGKLRVRQQALGTGGGIATTLRESAPGTTGGEAMFTAKDILDAEYRKRLAEATAGIDPFAGRIESEILGSQEFAKQRELEEAAIAEESTQFLTGRRTDITDAIADQVAAAQKQREDAAAAYGQAKGAETPEEIAAALKEAQIGGYLDPNVDVSGFNTELQKAIAAAPGERDAILNKAEYSELKDVPIGTIGTDKDGRQTYLIDGKDFRDVLGKTAKAVAFKKRQAELEEKFSVARGYSFPGGRVSGERDGETPMSALVSPMYFGEDIDMPQIKEFLDFDAGVRPSRGNVSTEEQRTQHNRIQDILGNLDKISESSTPFRAAMIITSIDEYLEAEEQALEGQKGLSKEAKSWLYQVKSNRKRIRKAKREKEYGKISDAILGAGLNVGYSRAVGEALA